MATSGFVDNGTLKANIVSTIKYLSTELHIRLTHQLKVKLNSSYICLQVARHCK